METAMSGSSSWMPYAPQGVKGFDDDVAKNRTKTPPLFGP